MRDCVRCGFTFPLGEFPTVDWGRRNRQVCRDCWATNPLIIRVAAIAADGLVRLRAIDALLYMGYVHAAHLIARGATGWPTILELREGTGYASSAVVVDLAGRRHDRPTANVAACPGRG